MRRFWFFKGAFFVIGGLALLSFVTMSLWNWLVPDLFHGPLITFWQGLGLVVLSRILFRGFFGMRGPWGGHRWRHHWRERWEKMTPEQREEWSKQWASHCGGRWMGAKEETEASIV